MADGETPEEAIREGADALASYLETLKALGRDPPATGDLYAGQRRQRVPRSLHAALARRAAREGVSLNMLVTTMLAEGLGRRAGAESRQEFRSRAGVFVSSLDPVTPYKLPGAASAPRRRWRTARVRRGMAWSDGPCPL